MLLLRGFQLICYIDHAVDIPCFIIEHDNLVLIGYARDCGIRDQCGAKDRHVGIEQYANQKIEFALLQPLDGV